jgi:hypothetical protein
MPMSAFEGSQLAGLGPSPPPETVATNAWLQQAARKRLNMPLWADLAAFARNRISEPNLVYPAHRLLV